VASPQDIMLLAEKTALSERNHCNHVTKWRAVGVTNHAATATRYFILQCCQEISPPKFHANLSLSLLLVFYRQQDLRENGAALTSQQLTPRYHLAAALGNSTFFTAPGWKKRE
jgi:hypothetical protein